MNVELQSYMLKKAHSKLAVAKEEGDEMAIECAERDIKLRMDMLEGVGFKVFADQHDVMLMS